MDDTELMAIVAHNTGITDNMKLPNKDGMIFIAKLDGTQSMTFGHIPQVDTALKSHIWMMLEFIKCYHGA